MNRFACGILGAIAGVILAAPAVATVHWNGPGGDQWNTNSSPFNVQLPGPLDIRWSSSFTSPEQGERPSGIVVADVGIAQTPYIFGSTGFGGNRPYRREANNGAVLPWRAQSGSNDSGTGFRITISPDGSILYHIDNFNEIRAYRTESDPAGAPLWHIDGDATFPGLANMIKVGPDGRIYGHSNGTAALDPSTGIVVWQSAANPEGALVPGAFWDTGTRTQYVVSGNTNKICAYDIASPTRSGPIWTYQDYENGRAGPTIDPVSGAIYIFRRTRVIKLDSDGNLIWQSPPLAADREDAWRPYGALSRDAATYYYQTGGASSSGNLYAISTSDGTMRWSRPTNGRTTFDFWGGPVVSANGMVLVANGAESFYGNRVICMVDAPDENEPTEIDSFELNGSGNDYGAPWISIGPGGVVYFDGRAVLDGLTYPEDVRVFALAPGPAIAIAPQVNLGSVTVGDTARAELEIVSAGGQGLVIESLVTPSADVAFDLQGQGVPLTVAAGETLVVGVILIARPGAEDPGPLQIRSSDRVKPDVLVDVLVDVRALEVTTRLPSPSATLPLGGAATIIVTPGPLVRIERGVAYFRSAQAPAFQDSVELGKSGDDFAAFIPGEHITETGLEYYVRVENSGFSIVDPPGAPTVTFASPVAAPVAIACTTRANDEGEYPAGRPIPVEVSMPRGAVVQSGRLFYRAGGLAAYDSLDLSLVAVGSGVFDLVGTIPTGAVGPRGVEYRVRVDTWTSTLSDPPQSNDDRARTVQTNVSDLEESARHAGGRYRMVSVPLVLSLPANATLEAILTDQPELGIQDPTRWRSFRYLPEEGDYRELSRFGGADGKLRPEPGRAFWLIAREAHRINTTPAAGRSTPTDASYRVRIAPGWNQVGNPYLFPVSFSSVRAEDAAGHEVILEPPVAWDETSAMYRADPVTVLMPFEGYWVMNPTEGPLDLVIAPDETAAGDADAVNASATEGPADTSSWRVEIAAVCEGARDENNLAGVATGGRDGKDRLDRSEPPMVPGPALSLYFIDDDLASGRASSRRSSDIRSLLSGTDPANNGHRWAFDLTRSSSEEQPPEVDLSFGGLDRVPSQFGVRLVDRVLERTVDLRQVQGYRFAGARVGVVSRSAEARFELMVGTEEYLAAVERGIAIRPRVTRLLPISPNPVRGWAVVRFEIARAGQVSVAVYDVAGRRVRTLVDGRRDGGLHELVWQGESDDGRSLPPGVYSVRLVGPDRTDVGKVIRIR